jgi:hypothetical protein
VPFVDQRNSKNWLQFGQQPISRGNLILFGLALFNEINKLDRQKSRSIR